MNSAVIVSVAAMICLLVIAVAVVILFVRIWRYTALDKNQTHP